MNFMSITGEGLNSQREYAELAMNSVQMVLDNLQASCKIRGFQMPRDYVISAEEFLLRDLLNAYGNALNRIRTPFVLHGIHFDPMQPQFDVRKSIINPYDIERLYTLNYHRNSETGRSHHGWLERLTPRREGSLII